jgi:3-methylfumaryl-CoA hydratase
MKSEDQPMLEAVTQRVDEQHLRTWIGREESTSDFVSSELARKFAATFDQTGSFAPADIVPRLIHFCLAQSATPTATLGEDGHPARGGFLPPVPLPRRMWAGGSITFTGDLHVGDTVRRVSRIADVGLKAGRTGPLCFVTVEHAVDVGSRPVLMERQDLVYRSMEAAPGGTVKAQPAAPSGTHRRSVDPSPPLLFRYSALTFNGHRIHYDRPYATKVEGYPGLVVHGPLQATLLMNFAAEIREKPPVRFTFRSQSPLFDGAPFALHADEAAAKLKLWTASEGGPVAMAAEAEWE